MTDKLPDVWTSRDYPVLMEIARRIDGGEGAPRADDIARSVDMDEDRVQRALAALQHRRLIEGIGVAEGQILRVSDISAEAYLLTGLHPDGDDAVSALVAALRRAADLTDDPAEKSRLRALADGALGVSRSVLAGVLTAVLTQQISS